MNLIKKLLQVVTLVSFVIGISGPGVTMLLTPDQKIAGQEKRELAQTPQLDWGIPFEKMVRDTQAYLNDQFGYRQDLIYWQAYLKAMYLQESPSNRVIIGQDGWLFLAEPDQVRDYQGLYTYDQAQRDYWQQIFRRRYDWLAERGILYVYVIAPDKKSIYPEYYPPQYPVIYPNNTRLDQFLATMQAQPDIPIIDLRIPLLDYKENSGDDTLLYHKTDTHWNKWGGYLAYAYLIENLQSYYPNLPLLTTTDLEYQFRHDNYGHGLAEMMGLEDAYSEDYPLYQLPAGQQCAKNAPYTGALYPERATYTACSQNEVNVIIFHDSFFRRIRPYLSESFGNTVYFYHTRFEPWLWEQQMEALIAQYQPTIVIEERVERILYKPPGWEPVIARSGDTE